MTHSVVFIDEATAIGGAEFVLLLHATQLRARGWDAQVIVPRPGPLSAELDARGVPVQFVPRPPLMSTSFYWRQRRKIPNPLALVVNVVPLLIWLVRVRAALARQRPDVIHSVSLWSHALAGVAGRTLGCPVVWHFQDIIAPTAGFGLYRRLMLLWARWWPSQILCVSEAVAAQFKADRRAEAKVRVLWNTVDLERFTPRPRPEALSATGTPLVIGTAARLTPWKGQEVALQTARRLRDQGVPFHWHFAGTEDLGSPGYQAYLAGLTRRWNLEGAVTWHGWVSDMAAFYRQLDVLVHVPLEPDPCPLILTEAMAAGLLIISATGGAADALVPAAGGDLVAPNQPEAVAERLAAAHRDRTQTCARGRRARRYAEATFSVQGYTDQLLQVYCALEANHGHHLAPSAIVGDRPGR